MQRLATSLLSILLCPACGSETPENSQTPADEGVGDDGMDDGDGGDDGSSPGDASGGGTGQSDDTSPGDSAPGTSGASAGDGTSTGDGANDSDSMGTGVPGTGFIAHVGCSQSRENINGYAALGGTRLESYMTGGGAIQNWLSPNSNYWNLYDQSVAGKTPEAGWLQICIRGTENTTYQDVITVLDTFKSKLPAGTDVYVSGLEIFVPEDLCGLAGDKPPLTRMYADMLDDDGHAIRGPELGPIDDSLTNDGCHPNSAGAMVTGQQLLDFFG